MIKDLLATLLTLVMSIVGAIATLDAFFDVALTKDTPVAAGVVVVIVGLAFYALVFAAVWYPTIRHVD